MNNLYIWYDTEAHHCSLVQAWCRSVITNKTLLIVPWKHRTVQIMPKSCVHVE